MSASPDIAVNRREFLAFAAIGGVGLVIGIPLPVAAQPETTSLHPLISIGHDGVVTIYAQNPEMGQGVKTSMPMIVAEELEVDWQQIRIEQADWDPALERQFSGGSLSIRINYDALRQAGASAREMLIAAAAERWGRPVASLRARNGHVVDPGSGERLAFGALAALAAEQPVPTQPPLKAVEAFRVIGNSVPAKDVPDIVTGTQDYSLDLVLPDMLYAVVARCPHGDGQPLSFDDRNSRSIAGVVDVRPLSNRDYGGRIVLPNCPNFVSGVAVLARNTWAAMQGARALDVEWALPDARDDSAALMERFEQMLDGDATVVRDDGSVEEAREIATTGIDVVYRLPFLAHVPMEPMNCTAHAHGGHIEIWAPTQNPGMAAEAVSQALGIGMENISIHVMRSGGAFGRRFYADFAVEAAVLSKETGRPVKVVWPREDDVRHDYFRPASVQRVRAGLDGNGRISFWQHKVVSHPREIFLERDGDPAEIANYEFPAAFVTNLRYEYAASPARIPLGQWRAVEHSSNVFAVSSAIDELAHAAGRNAVDFWLSLIGDDPFVQVREDFRFDASRLRAVIVAAANAAGWGDPLPDGRGRGIAASYNQGAWVAEVAEVTVTGDSLKVDRIVVAVDNGLVINPSGARQQVAGAVIEGLSAALYGEITVKDGMVEQSNFHDYRLCRIADVPEIRVQFLGDRKEAPRGLGEPPLPPVAPAVCNAIFAATGERIRELPLKKRFSV